MYNILNEIRNHKKLTWLMNMENEKAIIHNDIDGILTYAILNKYANLKKLVGIYDLDGLFVTDKKYLKEDELKNICGLDLDMNIDGMRTLGHHMTFTTNNAATNINDLFGISVNISSMYYSKYPLNTVLFLYAILGIKPKSDKEIALLIYADSVFTNFIKYKDNVIWWLEVLELSEVKDALINRYDVLMDIIDKEIAPIMAMIKDERKSSTYSQSPLITKFSKKYIGNPTHVLKLIKDTMGWEVDPLPSKLPYSKIYNNICLDVSKDTKKFQEDKFESIKAMFKKQGDEIISSSMTYKNSFKITLRDENKKIYNGKYGYFIQ